MIELVNAFSYRYGKLYWSGRTRNGVSAGKEAELNHRYHENHGK